ncbi:MAG: hypothetical protein IJ823_01890, partial [Bacteroidales bacterium]|nr:hypothetical protein [Bacteroidales bacterium]
CAADCQDSGQHPIDDFLLHISVSKPYKVNLFLTLFKKLPKTEHGGGAATGGLKGDPSMKSDPGTEGRRFLRGTFHVPSTKRAVLVDGEGRQGW